MLRSLQQNRRHAATDPKLIASCLAGDQRAWKTLIDRYAALILSIGVRMGLCQADAEDVLQNVCVLLFNHLSDLRDTARLSSWLISTTRREAWRLCSQRKAVLSADLPGGDYDIERAAGISMSPSTQPEASAVGLEEHQLMRQAMQRLQDPCHSLLRLLFCEDPPFSYADVAARLELPVGSIGPTRARCLQRLHKLLDELGF